MREISPALRAFEEKTPVAYRWRIRDIEGNVSGWAFSLDRPNISKEVLHDCEPLYSATQS